MSFKLREDKRPINTEFSMNDDLNLAFSQQKAYFMAFFTVCWILKIHESQGFIYDLLKD